MDGSKRSTTNSDARSAGDESEEPWQTGIRRRRHNSTSSNSEEPRQQSNATPSPRRHNGVNNNANGGNSNFNNSGFGIGCSGGAAAIGVGGPCGGNGGVAVGNQSSAAFGMMGSGGGGVGGGTPSRPYKTPSSAGKDLVAITPSSVTTAETAGSTLYTPSPLRVRRRRNSRRDQSSPSLRRQYQLLQSQTILLLGGAALGLMLFLFFALPMTAFISFTLMIASIGALVPVASSAMRARYELEMEQPMGLLRYLPDSLRVLLTETSIHQWMVEGTFWMDYRYLLLYVIPGIEEEQLMEFINRLPPRHRDVLLQPGLGRLLPPSTMRHFVRTQLPLILENEAVTADDNANVSVASGLTHDHDDHISILDEVDGGDHQVTLLEAIRSLRETLTSAEQFSPSQTIPSPGAASQHVDNTHTPVATATTANQNNSQVYERDDDNSSFDISLDLDMTDIIRELNTPEAAPSPENVVVEVSRSAANEQEEFEIEGRIISDAINVAVTNYSSQASAVVVESASEAVVSASTWLIRTGTLTGFVAGGGGILAAIASSPTPLSIILGSMVNRNASREVSSSSTEDRRNQTLSNQLVHGLLVTSVFGFASAGISYLIRNRVRASIAAKRQKRLGSSSDNKEE